ncbi:hypothetical protein BC332_23326 [Capsicum chinense]|nr:hypothetical protein BC332_23326 [Capsicum chinense]
MAKHAHSSRSIRGLPPINLVFNEIPSFSLALTQDEDINLIFTHIQSKRGVSIKEVRSEEDSLSSAGHGAVVIAKIKKLVEVIPLCLVACNFYEKKGIDIDLMLNLFDVSFMNDLPQQPSGSLDCGLYMVTYAEILTYGEGVPYVVFDPNLLRTRYASLLWDYGSRKEEDKAQSDDEALMRLPREIGITENTEVLEI